MSELFEAPPAFFRSRWLPPVCVVTGERTAVVYFEIQVPIQRRWWQYSRADRFYPLPLPLARGSYWVWWLCKVVPTLLFMLALLAAIPAIVISGGGLAWLAMAAVVVAFTVSFICAGVARFYLPGIRYQAHGDLVRIEMRSADAFQAFATAFMLWKEAEQIDTPIVYDLEPWAESVGTGWDEGKG